MSNWIKHPLKLEGEKIFLVPLETSHFDELINSSTDEMIWTFMPVNGSDKNKLSAALNDSLLQRELHEQYPFVIIDKERKKIIGSTRYLKISEEHKNLEIGWTWYIREYWGKGYNEECKLLLLQHCFEELKTIRVQLITWDKNSRSRKAIERIGAKFEGIIRNAVIRHDGKRSSAFYSILDDEWEDVKVKLTKLVSDKYAGSHQ
jgi:RimJ/RimL family protein N-acetyltransferase